PFEGSVRSGDSGGPALVDGEAVGVTSYGYNLDGSAVIGGDTIASAHTNIQRFLRLIDSIAWQQDVSVQSDWSSEFGMAGITIGDFR
ncbi:trypsin-like serine protease, partial [Paraburkholderia sp. SIMBA_061]